MPLHSAVIQGAEATVLAVTAANSSGISGSSRMHGAEVPVLANHDAPGPGHVRGGCGMPLRPPATLGVGVATPAAETAIGVDVAVEAAASGDGSGASTLLLLARAMACGATKPDT